MIKNPKVLIISARAGAGHVKAAESLFAQAHIQFPEWHTEHIDLVDYSTPLIKAAYTRGYVDMVKLLPELYAFGYNNFRVAKKVLKPGSLIDRFNHAKLFKKIAEFQPQVVISTHFIPPALLYNYRKRKLAKFKTLTVLTDYEYHPIWNSQSDFYTTAIEEMRFSMELDGIPGKLISVTGIPTHPKFNHVQSAARMRRKLKLSAKTPVVLITAGSLGVSSISDFINHLRLVTHSFQAVVVCGSDAKTFAKMKHYKTRDPRIKLVVGFTHEMENLLQASDFVVTKPGGLTTTECLVVGKPMLLLNPIPGQEEANASYLTMSGAAWIARGTGPLLYKFKELITSPDKRKVMAGMAKKIAKPNAAKDIMLLASKLI